jgi:hypothetical protein
MKRHVSLKDEMWPQNKMQNEKNPKQNDWQFNTLLGSAFLVILVFYQAFIITCHSENVVVTIWLMTPSFTNLTCLLNINLQLDFWNSCNCSIEMVEDTTMIFTSLVWIIPPMKQWLHRIWWSQGNKSEIYQMLLGKLEWKRYVNLGKDIWVVDATTRSD